MKDTNDNKRFWDKIAKLYTLIHENANSLYYKNLTHLITPIITSSDVVLEIGCGSGQLTQPLSPLAARWIATDFSDRMVAQTCKRVSNAANVTCRQEDATGLSFGDATFDVVVIANVLHIMPDPALALREIKRVLRPDGLLIAPTYIYDGNESRSCLRLLETIGFRTYNKWTAQEYETFVTTHGFTPKSTTIIPTKTLQNCLLTASPTPTPQHLTAQHLTAIS